jgi:hypothetical protein
MDEDYSKLSLWYEEKWLNWTPNTKNLHPSNETFGCGKELFHMKAIYLKN